MNFIQKQFTQINVHLVKNTWYVFTFREVTGKSFADLIIVTNLYNSCQIKVHSRDNGRALFYLKDGQQNKVVENINELKNLYILLKLRIIQVYCEYCAL